MKVLLIGYGSIGKRHTEILSQMDEVKSIDLITRREHKNRVAESVETCENLSDYGYIIISSETYRHYEQLAFLEQKVKNSIILVEKPLFHTSHQIPALQNKVFVAYNLRFHPVIDELRHLLKQKKILYTDISVGQSLTQWRPGRDYRRNYSASRKKGGGVLRDLSHELDYLVWLFGKPVSHQSMIEKISSLEIESEDFFALQGKTDREITFRLSMDYISDIPHRTIKVYTDKGTIFADLVNQTILFHGKDGDKREKFLHIDRNFTYEKMHQEILSPHRKTLCTYEEGLYITQLIDMIEKEHIDD